MQQFWSHGSGSHFRSDLLFDEAWFMMPSKFRSECSFLGPLLPISPDTSLKYYYRNYQALKLQRLLKSLSVSRHYEPGLATTMKLPATRPISSSAGIWVYDTILILVEVSSTDILVERRVYWYALAQPVNFAYESIWPRQARRRPAWPQYFLAFSHRRLPEVSNAREMAIT